MIYRAVVNFDFGKKDNNEYQKLIVALIQAGWTYVETSALWIETTNLTEIWQGLEIAAKQSDRVGIITSLTFHIQGTNDLDGKEYAAEKNHSNAKDDILALNFPS